MFLGRLICKLKRHHDLHRSILRYQEHPHVRGYALVTWHYNCLRCPHSYEVGQAVPFVKSRFEAESA